MTLDHAKDADFYHVEYLGAKHTHGWVPARCVEPYGPIALGEISKTMIGKNGPNGADLADSQFTGVSSNTCSQPVSSQYSLLQSSQQYSQNTRNKRLKVILSLLQ